MPPSQVSSEIVLVIIFNQLACRVIFYCIILGIEYHFLLVESRLFSAWRYYQ